MIPEPQLTYLLELLRALGPAAADFVVAGAQAMKFSVTQARGTKDFDFLLNVTALRKEPLQLRAIFDKLGYVAVPESRNFQFEKPIPASAETMRIEFMAPDQYKREKDFRVDIQEGVHARACTGGSIALDQSDPRKLSGRLPSGETFATEIRVTQPHALVMLKLLALADRYSNIRGPKEARHDREEAQTHAADIVAIVSAVPDIAHFNTMFAAQFLAEPFLGIRVHHILTDFFRETTSPGLLVYAEHVATSLPADSSTTETVRQETRSAQRVVAQILPPSEFFDLAEAINDSTEWEGHAPFVEEYLSGLENNRIPIKDVFALRSLPSGAFGGAYGPGSTFVMSASEPLEKLSPAQRDLLHRYLQQKTNALRTHSELLQKFPHTLTLAWIAHRPKAD
jgi:hypothetical protein